MMPSLTARASRQLRMTVLSIGGIAILGSCSDAPTEVATTGSIAPRLSLVRADSATRASLVLPLTAVRAQVIGPVSRVVDLQLRGSAWEGRATGLQAGTYEVIVEGLAGGEVQYYGRLASIAVARGATAEPFIAFAPSVPTVAALPLTTTTSFAQRVTFARVAAATSYTIQASQSSSFETGVLQTTSTDTTPVVAVSDRGTWFIRTRASLPQAGSPVPWSETRSWTVETASGGADAGAATAVPSALAATQTIAGRNLTSDKRVDWFSLSGVRAGDTLVVETFASRLELTSPLNSILTVFRADGVTEAGSNGDASGSTDSRVVMVATATETHLIRVTADGTTSGHFELRVTQRRLPAAPTGLSAALASATRATLSWTDASDNETSFRVERCTGLDCTTFTEIGSVAAGVTNFVDSTLTADATFRWRVRARNDVGNSAYTGIVTLASTAPAAPSGLAATVQAGNVVRLTWSDNANNETSALVERCTGVACSDFVQIAAVASASLVSYDDSSASADNTYRYRVRVSNAVGNSGYSAIVNASTAPTAPTGLTATTQSATTIALAWTDASATETQFVIERCTGVACTSFAPVDSVAANVTSRNNTVVADQTYSYRVRAVNASGSSPASASATADTKVPAAPTNFQGTVLSPTSLSLTWTDVATSETGYLLERCEGQNCAATPSNFVVTDTLPANTVSVNVTGLVTGTRYSFRLSAINAAGASASVTVTNLRPQ
ncbi:MAG: hypothetical protein C0503_00055 [Gemmatimonas sp.]|nr:hypothetical protein [Gemmatimonas sp.]